MIRPNDQHPLMQRGEAYRDYRRENPLLHRGIARILKFCKWLRCRTRLQIFDAIVFVAVIITLIWAIREMRVMGP